MPDDHSTLRRVIRLPQATAMVVGTIIGASIFVQPTEITRQVPSVGGVFLAWLASGLLTFFGALVCAELASIFTRTGGVYVYLREAFHPALGFLWGWAMLFSMHSGIIAVIAMVFGRYAAIFFPGLDGLDESGRDRIVKITAIGAIVVISAINYIGVKHGSTLQALFTLGKVLAILFIILAGFILGARLPDHFVAENVPDKTITVNSFLLALVAGLFAFGGWHMVTYNSEETVEPRKTIPRALMLGTLIVTVCYIAMNAVYMYILPLDEVMASERIAADAADAVLGRGGGMLLSGLVVFSTFGGLLGIILCGPRVYYAMAQDGLLFRWLGGIHPRYRTPHRAIVLQAVWASILVVTGTYRQLFTRVVYTEWIFFGLMAAGLYVFRRRPDLKPDYKVWGYPVVPAVFIVSSFAIVINQVLTEPAESLLGLSMVLIGLPVYYIWGAYSRAKYQKEVDA